MKIYRELIVPMTLHASGIRDIAAVLRVSANTVLAHLREAAAQVPEPRVPPRIKELEMDELWSFIGSKSVQCWLWLARNRRTGRLAAFELGRRTDQSCARLCDKLEPTQVEELFTDDWQSYGKYLDPQRHQIGKNGTQGIERINLNFRTHLKRLQRRTICYSRSYELHYAVIKLYIHHINTHPHF